MQPGHMTCDIIMMYNSCCFVTNLHYIIIIASSLSLSSKINAYYKNQFMYSCQSTNGTRLKCTVDGDINSYEFLRQEEHHIMSSVQQDSSCTLRDGSNITNYLALHYSQHRTFKTSFRCHIWHYICVCIQVQWTAAYDYNNISSQYSTI